jgi:hypothetical protein
MTNDQPGIRFPKLNKQYQKTKLVPLESILKLQISLLRGEDPLFDWDEILARAWGVTDRQI